MKLYNNEYESGAETFFIIRNRCPLFFLHNICKNLGFKLYDTDIENNKNLCIKYPDKTKGIAKPKE